MFIDLLWRCLSLLLKKYEEKIMEYLKNYMYVAHKVKEIIRKTDPDAKIYVFGSVVKGKYTASSDIDILVDFEKEGKTFDNYMGLKYFLQELFGLEVDLIMKGALKEELKDMILREVLYV